RIPSCRRTCTSRFATAVPPWIPPNGYATSKHHEALLRVRTLPTLRRRRRLLRDLRQRSARERMHVWAELRLRARGGESGRVPALSAVRSVVEGKVAGF